MEDARLIASNIDKDQFKEETEEEKKIRWGNPKYDVKKLLEELELKDKIPKLEEHKIDDEMFWLLEEGDFEGKLEISLYGQRKQLMAKIADIKEEHTKNMEEKDKLKDQLTDEDKKNIELLASGPVEEK